MRKMNRNEMMEAEGGIWRVVFMFAAIAFYMYSTPEGRQVMSDMGRASYRTMAPYNSR